MANKQDYIARLQTAIQHLHNCGAAWRETVPVHEVFQGQTIWQGEVEVFDLNGHPKAKRAYGWSHLDGPKDERERFVAVLEIPPVMDAVSSLSARNDQITSPNVVKYMLDNGFKPNGAHFNIGVGTTLKRMVEREELSSEKVNNSRVYKLAKEFPRLL